MNVSEKLRTAKLNQLRALVVEDDPDNRVMLEKMLERYNYTAIALESGETLEESLIKRFDIFLLDIMLPGKSGFDICKEVRAAQPEAPIIMITARDAEEDIVKGYACGADDYLIKPVRMADLRDRMNNHLRESGRARRPGHPEFHVGKWRIEPETLCAIHEDGTIEHLTDREFELLSLFAHESKRIVSRRMLLRKIWNIPNPERIATRTVDMHIAKLRKKMGSDANLFKTVRGQGYRYMGEGLASNDDGEEESIASAS